MSKSRMVALAGFITASTLALHAGWGQPPGVKRTDLQRHDLSTPGREVIQVLVEFGPNVAAARHSHPGEEAVFVTQGLLEYRLDGRPPVTLKAGEVLFVPAGVVHEARNVGQGTAAELATYIVDKGKPLVVTAK